MREVRIKKYLKKLPYSYALGFNPVMELLRTKPTRAINILFKNEANRYRETEQIRFLCQKHKIKCEFNNRLIDKISAKDNTYAAGVFEKYEEEIDPMANHIVLVNPSDFGNLGTIIRSMVAFNFMDLAIIKPAADIFDPKVISTTTGALFQIRFKHYATLDEYVEASEFHKLFLFSPKGTQKLKSTSFKSPFSLVFGHETRGIDKAAENLGTSVAIEQTSETDSLNLAVSASIAMYKASL